MPRVLRSACLCLLLGTSLSCASTPKEAALLSEAVGMRLADLQASHEAMLQAYFQLSRTRIDEFMRTRWTPMFMATFVADAGLAEMLETEPDREAILIDFMAAAQEQIDQQRRELLAPLETLERDALTSLQATYAELIQMQNLVTAHLHSVHDVSSERDQVLDRLGLLRTRDRILGEAVDLNDRVLQLTEATGDAAAVAAQIKQLLSPTLPDDR